MTLDLSLNNLIHVDLNMLRSSRHLKELNMAGNRLQSLPLDLTLHEELEVIDLTNNMLTTLEQHERQVLDKLTALVIVYVVSRSWTHLRYVWKVMQRLRLPRRENFRRDAYVGYADADWEFACVTLPACLQERHGVRLLLRDFEEVPGSIRAENIVQHIDDSWKQAQRSIMDTMPDRVLVVFMEDPARLPPMASLERLLRMVPEKNMLQWLSLASNKLRNLQADAMDGLEQLIVLDLSNNHLQLDHDTYPHGVFDSLTSLQELYLSQNDDRSDGKLTALEVLDLSGNNCYNLSTTIFDNLPVLRELRLSNLNLNPEFFRTHARRLFQNLLLLLTLDLSLNNLVHVDLHMLRSQRHLKELNMAGNRLQSLPLDLTLHEELEMIDLTNNMLTTLEQHERQVLDKLAGKHNLTLHLGGNPLLCACSNLDFVRWLWSTEVQLDGDGRDSRTFTCVTESGEVSDTHSVMVQYDTHWRRCVGQQVLGVTTAAFLLLLLALVIVYVVSRSWTHLRYVWKVMQQLRLPQRENFRRDAYVGYADADWEFACVTLPACLQERHGVRLLLRDFEEVPGSIRAENIVQHIDDSWKVVLLVTRAFATDEWLCGFTVQQAQRSIMDTMPDRVLVVFMEDPARLPPMASLERLLRMVPEKNVVHMRRDTPQDYPVWDRLARDILDRKRRDEY
nr:hypothetical protein BaRGS_030007 [Batillaria attramentaria]